MRESNEHGYYEDFSESKIEGCENFEELYQALREIGRIKGSREEPFTAEELIGIIEDVRQGKQDRNYITNTFQIRKKVINLLFGGRSAVAK